MSFAPGANLHDLLRHVIRSFHWSDEGSQREALAIVDGDEAGFHNLGEWQAELTKRAAAAARIANPDAPETDAEKAARLEAVVTQLQAQMAAQRPTAPATPAPPQ